MDTTKPLTLAERDLIQQLSAMVRAGRIVARGIYATLTVIDDQGNAYTVHAQNRQIRPVDAMRITNAVIKTVEQEALTTHLLPAVPNPTQN